MEKNILLCGKNSYVGSMLIKNLSGDYIFTELDMRTSEWENFDFKPFDTIIYLAAIVHKPDIQDGWLFKKVNEELPVKVAELSVKQGVKQFVFFSTMAVYGLSPSLSNDGKVSVDTVYHPNDFYGKSKLNAEIQLVNLQREYHFVLSIVRPPNIYGENCPGNYYRYMKLCAKYMFVFPLLRHNKFSMIHVDNLSNKIGKLISGRVNGLVCPQDPGEKSNAKRIARLAKENNRVHYQSIFLGKILYGFYKIFLIKQIANLFGDMYYDDTLNNPIPLNKINYPLLVKY
ncbi:MAG: NAD-dependent epimerase/dehydratase family protein [Mangrovibacterium sp.]